ncbi:hypothetical protein GCM10022243_47150 [Saccharothrix violaceirubra]|uniref:Uncharacterized protein n=1 Tax=Saccharothrix violaceirubra TaxID=413306 RepID=A0A7W7WXS3_9PSEU|nr:hypothetical protein [Saccharothrix violaceirubra]MBB4967744.1 hypothetical protein [Saccharothrix violaceirubra]
MTNPEVDSLAELIDDCTDLPRELRTAGKTIPAPRAAEPWQVDEDTYRQVEGLDAFV